MAKKEKGKLDLTKVAGGVDLENVSGGETKKSFRKWDKLGLFDEDQQDS